MSGNLTSPKAGRSERFEPREKRSGWGVLIVSPPPEMLLLTLKHFDLPALGEVKAQRGEIEGPRAGKVRTIFKPEAALRDAWRGRP